MMSTVHLHEFGQILLNTLSGGCTFHTPLLGVVTVSSMWCTCFWYAYARTWNGF